MDDRRIRSDQDWLNILSGQFLLILTFMLNLLTTIGVIWTTFKFGLDGNDLRDKLFTINGDSSLGELISFQRGVAASSLLVKDRLSLDEIANEMISFGSTENSGKNRVAISLNPDYISLQANSYGAEPTDGNQYSFKIDRELEKLIVSGIIYNIRSLKSIGQELRITSNDQLELSGNLGLNVHSSSINIDSSDKILVESKEDAIEIRSAPGGLIMPQLRVHQEPIATTQDEENRGDSLNQEMTKGHFLCIRKSDGMVYKTQSSCN